MIKTQTSGVGNRSSGPCSNILTVEKSMMGKVDCMVGCDCDRYIEIWNLTTQFDKQADGTYEKLPTQY